MGHRSDPVHVAIIMDGNGRWASERGLPRVLGHRAGMEALKKIVKASKRFGIKVLTLFAFSTENWKRPRDEVEALMELLVEYVRHELDELRENGVRIRVMGHVEELPEEARAELETAVKSTENNDELILNIALNYGGRREITDAARELARKAREGQLDPGEIDEELFSQHLYTAGIPDPDLLIRPSGEMRISNFLLWQIAYTELWVTPVYWPDFTPEHLEQALREYRARERRFGGIPAVGSKPSC